MNPPIVGLHILISDHTAPLLRGTNRIECRDGMTASPGKYRYIRSYKSGEEFFLASLSLRSEPVCARVNAAEKFKHVSLMDTKDLPLKEGGYNSTDWITHTPKVFLLFLSNLIKHPK